MTGPLLEAQGLAVRLGGVEVLAGIDLVLAAGEVAALLGPSGAGKSSLVRALAGLEPLAAGEVLSGGVVLGAPGRRAGAAWHRLVQPLFQEPGASLNPRRRIGALVADALRLAGAARGRRARAAAVAAGLAAAGLPPDRESRFPHQLSGGERQRAALARVLAAGPRVLLLDEPFAALDPALRGELAGRLRRLAGEGRAVLVVTHDWAGAVALADRLGVLAGGRIVEWGPAAAVAASPAHPWSRALRAAAADPLGAPLPLDPEGRI